MSTLPDVNFQIQDGALGVSPASTAGVHVKLGVCAGGVPNTLYSFSDPTVMQATLVAGPLVEAGAYALTQAGGPVLFMPVNPSAFGFAGSVSHVGTGVGTVAASLAPSSAIVVTITAGGVLGVGAFTYSVGGSPTSAPVTLPAGGTFLVPGTLTVLTFPAGTYVLLDTYTTDVFGVVTHVGVGPTVTQQSSPLDNYNVVITIATGGGLGAGVFTYSVDGGNVTSAPVQIPGSGKYAIQGTGIVLTFASTFVALDTYSFLTVTAGFSPSDVNAALVALRALSSTWGFAHVVGTPASAAGAASLAATIDTNMIAAESEKRFTFGLMECPTVGTTIVSGSSAIADTADTDAVIEAAFASFVSVRTSVFAGDAALVSPVTGRIVRRNGAWALSARLASVPISEDAGKFLTGTVGGVTAIYRNEQATPRLDAARFCTFRTFLGIPGFYFTGAYTMGLTTSDFHLLQNRRVMDQACSIVRSALLNYLNAGVLVNKNGTIQEKVAKSIEAAVNRKLNDGLIATSPANASAATIVVSRTENIVSTSRLPVTVRVTPLGYARDIEVNIGFQSPAQAAA